MEKNIELCQKSNFFRQTYVEFTVSMATSKIMGTYHHLRRMNEQLLRVSAC